MCPASPPVGLLAVVPGLISRDMIQSRPSIAIGGLTTGIHAQSSPKPTRFPFFNGHMAVIEAFYNGFETALPACLRGPKGVLNGHPPDLPLSIRPAAAWRMTPLSALQPQALQLIVPAS